MPQASEPQADAVPNEPTRPSRPGRGDTFDPDFLTSSKRAQVKQALREAQGNKAAAARLLGISRRSMYRWLDRLDLAEPDVTAPRD